MKTKTKNPVAKYARKYNVAAVHIDRKKESKKTGKYYLTQDRG